MKSLLCHLVLSCLAPSPDGASVADLHYGAVLYEYHQDNYELAMVETLYSEARGRRGDDAVRFELAEGSFAFADGMYTYARNKLEALDEAEISDVERMRLSFHLAREYFRRGEWAHTAEQIERIDLGSSWLGRERFHPEVEFMRAELATVDGDFGVARERLAHLDEESAFKLYALYNLGVAARERGELDVSHAAFTELVESPADDEESLDLVHRGKLALAFISRERGDVADANTTLTALPASGRYRDVAMATYGTVAMEQENYELAARIWMALKGHDYWTPSTATARLGFPVSLEHLASEQLALAQYRVAERNFENRLTKLNALVQQANDPDWVRELLHVFASVDRNPAQMDSVVSRWRDELGHTDWLEWLSTETVHRVLMDWQRLTEMDVYLDDLPETLAVYESVALEQKRRADLARRSLDDVGLQASRAGLGANVAAFEARLASHKQRTPAPTVDWMRAIADPEQLELAERFARMQRVIELGIPAADQRRWMARVERLRGLLFWDLVELQPARVRSVEKSLRDARDLTLDADSRMHRIAAAEESLINGIEADFVHFRDRTQGLQLAVSNALDNRQGMLAQELRDGMIREMAQVREYLLVARLAVARTTDSLAAIEVAP